MKTLRENEGFFCVQESGFPSGSSSPTAFDYTNTKQKIEQTKFFQEVIGSLTAVGVKYMVGRSWTYKPLCRGRGRKKC